MYIKDIILMNCMVFKQIVKRLLEREKPFCAKLNFPVVDVRDVAVAHIKAMTVDDAAGELSLHYI